jgi:outer membrane receptor for ferric coprogen and ferric-rhodotorulic acid
MTHHPSRTAFVRLPVRTKTAMAVQSALFVGLLAGIAVLPHDAAYAQGIATQTIPAQQYNIAAGTLGSVLNNFASAAGIELSADAVLTQNKQSSGLRGNYTVAEGFAALLRGQGLQVVRATNGAYSLRAVAANSNEATLPDVVVTAQSQHGAVTEGTGAYATKGITATATRLGLTVRETPQSISVVTRQQMDDRKLENIANVMDATVGITSFRQGVGVDLDQMYSRGFAVSNYMIDGMPVNASSGTLRIGTSMFDRVEVVRGATGLMSGMGQPGAAINLVRKRPLHESYSSIDVEAGNWNRYGVGLDLSRLLNEDGSARGRLVIDFKDKGSWLDRYTSQSRLIYGVTEFDINKDTLLSVGFSHQEDDHDSPMRTGAPIYYSDGSQINLPRSYNNAPDWTFYNTKRSRIDVCAFRTGWTVVLPWRHRRD